MNDVIDLINFLFPILSVILLAQGIIRSQNTYVKLAFCIACISFFLQIKASRGEIIGSYFDSKNVIICTLDLIVLNGAALLLGSRKIVSGTLKAYFGRLFIALSLLISLTLLFQLWTNIFFESIDIP